MSIKPCDRLVIDCEICGGHCVAVEVDCNGVVVYLSVVRQ